MVSLVSSHCMGEGSVVRSLHNGGRGKKESELPMTTRKGERERERWFLLLAHVVWEREV